MGRGKLRIYLGAAPGVGKTYAMLSEAHRRIERGTDCVVAVVEHHGRPRTEVMLHGLEQIPRRELTYRDAVFTEMDVDAVLARRPHVALVDELAHTNVPGSRNDRRWQDVQELLAAGIDVVSTVDIQHLESLGDVVESITGVRQRETVPDEVVRRADRTELVDMSPQALRRRMAHGNVYQPDRVDAALSHYFRPGNPTALREPALLWVADRADEYLNAYRSEHQVSRIWGSRERIVVGLTGGREGRTLIRRAVRLAEKGAGGEAMAVYIARSDGPTSASPKELAAQRTLVVENAVKYSPLVTPAQVSAGALGGRVEVLVTDRGPGVPGEATERIFAPFQRHGDAPRGTGVGLGLAVARGFAEAMGGTLDAEDTPGGGLTMVLTVRAVEKPPGPDTPPASGTDPAVHTSMGADAVPTGGTAADAPVGTAASAERRGA
ncbi:ATP-binding protein [Streptomyces scabiei]|uniref:ATP-binding protein n=1 Tax=Streptomyces scabiei TaxID=1930 RepID=UPI0039F68980